MERVEGSPNNNSGTPKFGGIEGCRVGDRRETARRGAWGGGAPFRYSSYSTFISRLQVCERLKPLGPKRVRRTFHMGTSCRSCKLSLGGCDFLRRADQRENNRASVSS